MNTEITGKNTFTDTCSRTYESNCHSTYEGTLKRARSLKHSGGMSYTFDNLFFAI